MIRAISNFCYFWGFLFVPCQNFRSPYLGKTQQLQEQRYPFLSVSAVFLFVATMVWLPLKRFFFFFFLTCAQMLMHAIAHGACTDTVTESALEVDSGRKIPCRTGDSNPASVWRPTGFSVGRSTVYQRSYSDPDQAEASEQVPRYKLVRIFAWKSFYLESCYLDSNFRT